MDRLFHESVVDSGALGSYLSLYVSSRLEVFTIHNEAGKGYWELYYGSIMSTASACGQQCSHSLAPTLTLPVSARASVTGARCHKKNFNTRQEVRKQF